MALERYALVVAGVVENVTRWDGVQEYNPEGVTLVNIEGQTCVGGEGIGPGCTYAGGVFTYGVLPQDVKALNRQTLLNQIPQAMAELDQIVTRGATFLSSHGTAYAPANLAQATTNLNDLRTSMLAIVGGVPADGSGGLMALARDIKALIRLAANVLDETD